MGVFKDIKGQRFNNLTVLELLDKTERGFYWLCKCDCGNEIRVLGSNIIRGHTKSCGCLKSRKSFESPRFAHGGSNTRLYRIWSGIKTRCTNPHEKSYKNYGGRGINICDRWLVYGNFYEDMKETYKEDLTIDRIDNDKGYYKENCRWATDIEQANNVRINVLITVDGITDTMANTCRKYNANYNMVRARILKGWNPEKAVKTEKMF